MEAGVCSGAKVNVDAEGKEGGNCGEEGKHVGMRLEKVRCRETGMVDRGQLL